MIGPLRWHEGSSALRSSVDAGLGRADLAACLLARGPRRALLHLPGPDGDGVLLKLYAGRSGRHRWREQSKSLVGWAAPQREWRALRTLADARVAVPMPLGMASTERGDTLIVSLFVEGESLHEALLQRRAGRRATLLALSESVRAMHAAGLCHGDLHPGNVILGAAGPVIVDWQRAARARPGSRRALADLARLDFSLAGLGVSRSDRLRVVSRSLFADGRPDRATLKRVARMSRRLAARHRRRRRRESARGRDAAPGPALQSPGGSAAHSPSPTRSYSDLFMLSPRSTKLR